jgi:catechol 1,2-dioxygenase
MTSYDDRRFAGDYVRHDEPHPSDAAIRAPWYALDYTHVMEPGGAILPQPPIK